MNSACELFCVRSPLLALAFCFFQWPPTQLSQGKTTLANNNSLPTRYLNRHRRPQTFCSATRRITRRRHERGEGGTHGAGPHGKLRRLRAPLGQIEKADEWVNIVQ